MSRIAEDKVQLLKGNLSDSARQVIGEFAREAGINQQDLIGDLLTIIAKNSVILGKITRKVGITPSALIETILVDFLDRYKESEIRLEPVKLVRSNVDS